MLQDERRPFFPGATEESLAFTNAACRLESSGARVTVLVAVVPSLQLTATQKALDRVRWRSPAGNVGSYACLATALPCCIFGHSIKFFAPLARMAILAPGDALQPAVAYHKEVVTCVHHVRHANKRQRSSHSLKRQQQ